MTEQHYAVAGMTCENCRRHVAAALAGIPGAREVHVDLEAERATVSSDRPLADDEVRAALDEAGYGLA